MEKKFKKKKKNLFSISKPYSLNFSKKLFTDAFYPHTAFATVTGLSCGDMDLMTYNTTHCGYLASGTFELP